MWILCEVRIFLCKDKYMTHTSTLLRYILLTTAMLSASLSISAQIQKTSSGDRPDIDTLSDQSVEHISYRLRPVAPPPHGALSIVQLLGLPLSSQISLSLQPVLHLEQQPWEILPPHGSSISNPLGSYGDEMREIYLYNQASLQTINRLKLQVPSLVKREYGDLLAHRKEIATVNGSSPIVVADVPTPFTGVNVSDQVQGVTLERKYWFPGLESNIQFSQTYISPNWHKGGNSALNLHSKQLLRLDYKKDNINWANEVEWRLGLNTEIRDSLKNYNISEDLIRFRSNLGIKAFKNWFYSVDVEARSQFFPQSSEDKKILYSAFASPLTLTAGIGMRWVIDKKYESHYGRRLRVDMNIAPLAYDFKWSYRKDIDLARHGFEDGKNIYSKIGSMFRLNMILDFTDSFAWESRIYYNTSYKRVESEFENSLIFAFNRYFSTRINVLLRFDDAAPIVPPSKTRLQTYEMLTIGFDMKI